MSNKGNQAEERLYIALVRIAAEKSARTGRLDLANLGLTVLPMSLSELDWLEDLRLGGVCACLGVLRRLDAGNWEEIDEPYNPIRLHAGNWEEIDEPYNPNHIKEIGSSLMKLSRLRILDCSCTDFNDLATLASLAALQSLNCSETRITDLAPLAGLSSLQSLDCSKTRITDLAPLAGLSSLQSLDCSETQITDLVPLAGLSSLQSLDCMSTRITDLAPLAGLFSLQFLDCTNAWVTDLTPLARVSALQSLHCANVHVTDFALLADLPALRYLDLSATQIADLAPLAGLTALQNLNCRETQITDLSPLAGLIDLRYLWCGVNPKVTDLTPLAGLTALQALECDETRITDLSPLAGLSALRYLCCAYTPVADLAPLAGLSALQDLNCRKTPIADLVPLAGLSELKVLNCGGTQVTDLTPLAGLFALQDLDCGDTQVADLTPLAGLTALQSLYCWDTSRITNLPEAVIGLPRLNRLAINPQPGLDDIPAEVLSQYKQDHCLPRLRAHLADLDAGAEPLRDLKVIVLGNGRVGKTQTCRRLRTEPFEADADSTHGISVTSVELAMPTGEESAILNLWDFGGQDIYHGTHALFMQTRAVFLLVWTPDSEQGEHAHGGMVFRNHPLPYWLEYIRHLGGEKSPVILLQNQCDGGLGECLSLPVDETLLRPLLEDGRLFTRIAYSAKDDSGRPRLMDALQQAVSRLREAQGRPRIGRNRLVVWDQLRAWRDLDAREPDETSRRHRLLPYQDFETLCCAHQVRSPETFTEVLHNAGMIFYQAHLFDNQLVLDQSWALNAVYAVFTREGGIYDALRRRGGFFTRSDLDLLLWRARVFGDN
jgi:internalin A